jgi:hypothetical protein
MYRFGSPAEGMVSAMGPGGMDLFLPMAVSIDGPLERCLGKVLVSNATYNDDCRLAEASSGCVGRG